MAMVDFDHTIARRSLVLGVVTTLALAVYVAAPARADQKADVEKIVQRGIDFRRSGHDQEALVEFQRAAKIQETPRIAAQIALAEQALGMWADAHRDLLRALEHSGDSWIQQSKATLDRARDTIESNLGQVEVWGTPTGAEVLLDEKPIGNLPSVKGWLAPAEVTLRVKAGGYVEFSRTLNVVAGGYRREHVELRPRLSPPKVAIEPSAVAMNATQAAQVEKTATAERTPTAEAEPAPEGTNVPIYRKWWFWTLVGAGAIAAGGTIWFATRKSNTDTCTGICSSW
jgi:hypothetical protein